MKPRELEDTDIELADESLVTALDKLGYTPLDEPELGKALGGNDFVKIATLAIGGDKKEALAYIAGADPLQVGCFISKVRDRVVGKKKDGEYKVTPKIENCQKPNFIEAQQIMEISQAVSDSDLKLEDRMKAMEELDTLIWDVASIGKDDLTDWEKEIVHSQIVDEAIGITASTVGKRFVG